MNKNKRQYPAIVIFAILTAVTTFVWIGFEVFSTLTDEPEPTVPESATAELAPDLDTQTLSEVQNRLQLEDVEIGDTQLTIPTDEPTPEPSPTPAATASPEPTDTIEPSPTPTEEPNASAT